MNWSLVRSLGKVKYFGISYIVLAGIPILSAVHESGQRIPFLNEIIGEFPVNLKLVFLASLFYAIGVAVYQIFCPEQVKSFSNEIEYFDNEYEVALRSNPTQKEQIVLTHLSQLDKKYYKELESLVMNRQDRSSGKNKEKIDHIVDVVFDSCVQHYILSEYARKDASMPALSWISFLSFIAGTAILLYLLVVKSIAVLF